jgi:hypothetical protein
MVIVAGHVVVDPQQRADYLAGCLKVAGGRRGVPRQWPR